MLNRIKETFRILTDTTERGLPSKPTKVPMPSLSLDEWPPVKKAMDRIYITNLESIADYIDRMAIETHKVAFFENEKRKEHRKKNPNAEKIAAYDAASRVACEYRSRLKNKINESFREMVETKVYRYLPEVRTFGKADPKGEQSIGELIADRFSYLADESHKQKFANALRRELKK